MLVTTGGIAIRQSAADIRSMSRGTQGTRLQKLGDEERVAAVALVVVPEDEEGAEEAPAT